VYQSVRVDRAGSGADTQRDVDRLNSCGLGGDECVKIAITAPRREEECPLVREVSRVDNREDVWGSYACKETRLIVPSFAWSPIVEFDGYRRPRDVVPGKYEIAVGSDWVKLESVVVALEFGDGCLQLLG